MEISTDTESLRRDYYGETEGREFSGEAAIGAGALGCEIARWVNLHRLRRESHKGPHRQAFEKSFGFGGSPLSCDGNDLLKLDT